jgi:anti-sigma factor RsiW
MRPDVIDLARGVALDASRQTAVRAHLAACAPCAARFDQERGMSAALSRIAHEPEPEAQIRDRTEQRVDVLLAAFDGETRRPRGNPFRVWVPVAASLTILVGLMLGWTRPVPTSRADRAVTSTGAGPSDSATSFVLMPDAGTLPRFDHGELIRVEIPSASGPIQADVLVGQDGFARAVRLVE